MTISEVLRDFMASHDLPPAEMARRCGVSRQYLNGLINGKTQTMRLDKAVGIAAALGMSIDELAQTLYGQPNVSPDTTGGQE